MRRLEQIVRKAEFGVTRSHQRAGREPGRQLHLCPEFSSAQEEADVLRRLSWYLSADRGGSSMPNLRTGSPCSGSSDLTLVWRAERRLLPWILRNRGRVRIVDPEFWSTAEANTHLRLRFYDIWDRNRRHLFAAQSADKLGKMTEDLSGAPRAYVFGTGPSLSQALDMSFDDGMRIVCNSIVRSPALLDHVRPNVIVATDPVFHFGSSAYAQQFRVDLRSALQRTGAWCVVPLEYGHLLVDALPDLADRIVSVHQKRSQRFHLPTPSENWTRATGNVLTGFMVPLAVSLAGWIGVVGCDGRRPSDSGFWRHDQTAQYDTLYQSVVAEHPSFFRDRDYFAYYRSHVATLERQLSHFEDVQGANFDCLTPTEISALRSRSKRRDD